MNLNETDDEVSNFPFLRPIFAGGGLEQLQSLDFSGQGLSILPSKFIFSIFRGLRSLNLAGNCLETINGPSLFEGTPHLTALNISNNRIGSFQVLLELTNLAYLEQLDVSGNPATANLKWETLLERLVNTDRLKKISISAALSRAHESTVLPWESPTRKVPKKKTGFPVYIEKKCLPRNFGNFRRLEILNGTTITYKHVAAFADFEKLTDIIDPLFLKYLDRSQVPKADRRGRQPETSGDPYSVDPNNTGRPTSRSSSMKKHLEGFARRHAKFKKNFEEIYHVRGDREKDALVSIFKISKINASRKFEEKRHFDRVQVIWNGEYKGLTKKLAALKKMVGHQEAEPMEQDILGEASPQGPEAVPERPVLRPQKSLGIRAAKITQETGENNFSKVRSMANSSTFGIERAQQEKNFLNFGHLAAALQPHQLLKRANSGEKGYKKAAEGAIFGVDVSNLTGFKRKSYKEKASETPFGGHSVDSPIEERDGKFLMAPKEPSQAPDFSQRKRTALLKFGLKAGNKETDPVQNQGSAPNPIRASPKEPPPNPEAEIEGLICELRRVAERSGLKHLTDAIDSFFKGKKSRRAAPKSIYGNWFSQAQLQRLNSPTEAPVIEKDGVYIRGSPRSSGLKRSLTNRINSAVISKKSFKIRGSPPPAAEDRSAEAGVPVDNPRQFHVVRNRYLREDKNSMTLRKAIFVADALWHSLTQLRKDRVLAKVNENLRAFESEDVQASDARVDSFMEWEQREVTRDRQAPPQPFPNQKRRKRKRKKQGEVGVVPVQLQPPPPLQKPDGGLIRNEASSRIGSAGFLATKILRI